MRTSPDLALLSRLEKAVTTGTITAVVPEDLEVQAHSTLWDETDGNELTLLKLAPKVPAKQIRHEFARITSYGFAKNSGFFGEQSLPPETNFGSDRNVVNIRLMGEIGPTFLLAALEETVKALGTSGAQNIERVALMKSVLFKKNRNLYFSDTRTTRLGENSLRFKGIMQQIEEGTDGTVASSIYGSHVIDMAGDPLTVDTIRDRMSKSETLFGTFNSLIMDPLVRSDFEATLDGATRLPMPIASAPYMIGQQIAGLQSQNKICKFYTDNGLTPIYSRWKYTADLVDGAPTTIPTVSTPVAGAPGGGRTSYWDANSAASVFYVVTEVVNEREGLGVRAPTGTSTVAVAAGEEITFTVTPGNPTADSFRIYRGTSAATAATEAWFIREWSNSGGGAAVSVYDDNAWRPNTSIAFGLNIVSDAQRAMAAASPNAYEEARQKAASYLTAPDRQGNTIAVAALGPDMGIMALASVLAHVDRPLVYSACAPEVRNAFQNIVFKNIGRRS